MKMIVTTVSITLSLIASASNLPFPRLFILPSDSVPKDSLQFNQDSLLIGTMKVIQDELVVIHETLDEIENKSNPESGKKKFVHFGLSLGYRWLTNNSQKLNMFPSISPIDSTLRITALERTSYLFSTSVIFDLNLGKNRKPGQELRILEQRKERQNEKAKLEGADFKPKPIRTKRTLFGHFIYQSVDRLCIISNLNILDFSNGQKELAFNKSIEGGLGIGYRLNEVMYIGFNWEHVQSWQLYEDIKNQEGQKIEMQGNALLSSNQLDADNEDLFYKKNLSGWGLKIIVTL